MGCSRCQKAASAAAAKLKAGKSMKHAASNDFSLSQLLVVFQQIETSTAKGVTYRNQWASRLAKRRKILVSRYPDRIVDFDNYVSKSIPFLSAAELNKETTRIKTIVSVSDYKPN